MIRRPLRLPPSVPRPRLWVGLVLALAAAAPIAAGVWAHARDAERPTPGAAPDQGPGDLRARDAVAFKIAFERGDAARRHPLAKAVFATADPLRRDVLEWSRLALSDGGDWTALSSFLARRPDWPRDRRLRRRAEEAMPEALAPAAVLAFFDQGDRKPLTARGARLLGEALIATGNAKRGRAVIVAAWRETPAPPAEERLFTANHGTLLAKHHRKRLETMLWRDRLNSAQRVSRLLGPEARALTTTWIALVRGRGNVDRMIQRLPSRVRSTAGIAYARVVWRKERRRFSDAESLMLQVANRRPPAVGVDAWASAWADERLYFSREAFEEGRYRTAYRLAGPHGLEEGYDFARLEWFAGWIALKKLNQPEAALRRFKRMWTSVSRPISQARAAYWAGEAAAALKLSADARRWRERAAAHPNTFYGQLAARRLGRRLETPAPDGPARAASLDQLDETGQAMVQAAALLYRAGEIRAARWFLRRQARRTPTDPALRLLAATARAHGDPGGEIAAADVGQRPGAKLWSALYPVPTAPPFTGRKTEAALLLAIARQESRFTPDALSHAGARGLMQIMPRTARATARAERVPFDRGRLARDPAYSLMLADAHIQALLRDYKGSYLLVAAAYNAGGGNVGAWIRRFGDPRDPAVDPVQWIESIPFSETRNYVQRVLEAVQVYRARLSGGPVEIATPDALRP